ncbi:MAG: lanthionine synthetase LanC family protein, partial [Curtobacterium sp.]
PDRALLAVHAVRASLPHESWASTLLAVETSLAGRTASLAETIRERLAAGRSPVFHEFDMLLGLGQGALGLDVAQDPARAVEVAGALADLLAASPLPGGVQVDGPPFTGGDWTGEHVNFGLAHGGAGVLHALCSVAFRLRPDQRTPLSVDVAEAAVAALRSRADAIPPFAGWSGTSWSDEPAQYRPSWCYGIVGHALVFAMASLALDRPEHLRHAVELLHEAFRRIDSFEDHSLCHGTAGLVAAGVVVGALDDELGATLGPAVSGLADRMATDHDSSTAFGFSYTSRGFAEAVPVPGVLNGTAGIGLALVLARGGLPRASAIDALLRMSPWTSAPAVRAARWSHS